MPAFKKLGPGDQIDNVLVLEPQWTLVSGTSGWRGSPEGSSSLNLYGGTNRLQGGAVQGYQYSNLIPEARSYGAPRRSSPITASVRFVYMTNEDRTITQRSDTRWGYEHWKTTMGLYSYYNRRDPDYVTASYDHYVLYFQKDSKNIVISSGALAAPVQSFTLESWVQPFNTASYTLDTTIQSMNAVFRFGLTGSSGKLFISGSNNSTVLTASAGPTQGQWSHVAYSYDSASMTGTFYVNTVPVGTVGMTPLASWPTGVTTLYTVGNKVDNPLVVTEGSWSTGTLGRSFRGLIGETRFWTTARTQAQLSSSYNHRLTGSDLSSAQSIFWFNEGPLGSVAGFSMGSGALDQARSTQGASFAYARLVGFNDRFGPVWHPSDNTGFFVPKTLVTGSVSRMLVVAVPAAMSGRQIVPNSVRLSCNAFSAQDYGLTRTLLDDGRGGLYLSGSVWQDYPASYPSSANDLDSALGSYGAVPSYAWLCDDVTGSLTSSIGGTNSYLAPTDSGDSVWPTYRNPGPGVNDYAVKMVPVPGSPNSLSAGFTGSASFLNIGATTDLVFTWVAKLESALDDSQNVYVVDKYYNVGQQGFRVFYQNSGGTHSAGFFLQNLTHGSFTGTTSAIPSSVLTQWHTGLFVLDRASGLAYVLICTLGGTVYKSAGVNVSSLNTLTNTQIFSVGTFENVGWQLGALYAGTEAGTITTNVSGAIASFASVINSTIRANPAPGRDSVGWNKVGNVFYNEGLITIKDPALLDFGADWTNSAAATPSDLLQVDFKGQSRIPVKTIVARIDRGDLNSSLNPTYYTTEEDGFRSIRHPSGSLYVTTVGLYNSDHELVGVARLAEPLRVRPRDRLAIKIRMDF